MPEYMSENLQSQMIEGELHLSEAIEEKLPHGQLPSESEPKSPAEETPPNSEDIKTT
jgi:hypothetical protein